MQIAHCDDGDDEGDGLNGKILIAAATAAVTTLVTSLVSWGVDELRSRYGTPKEKE